MTPLKEGEKRVIRAEVKRTSGSGAIVVSAPQFRIVAGATVAARAVVAGFDWASATWDGVSEISALFDSTIAALSAPGNYYLQFRGVIGVELYEKEITVKVADWGP
jgi:hypothetical protein